MQQKLNTMKNKKRKKTALDVNHTRAKQKRRVEFEDKVEYPRKQKKTKTKTDKEQARKVFILERECTWGEKTIQKMGLELKDFGAWIKP